MESSPFITNNLITSGQFPVMESFYTIQGEGHFTGTAAYFIRLAGCDVGCVWCDVKESWQVSEQQYRTVESVLSEVLNSGTKTVVITGGEPCMYDLTILIEQLRKNKLRVHIETSGAYPLSGNPDWVCVSPKKFKFPLEEVVSKADELKVVVSHISDLKWAEQHAAFVKKDCFLFLQPEYEKSTRLLPLIVDYAKNHPEWRISLQTHKYIGIP